MTSVEFDIFYERLSSGVMVCKIDVTGVGKVACDPGRAQIFRVEANSSGPFVASWSRISPSAQTKSPENF